MVTGEGWRLFGKKKEEPSLSGLEKRKLREGLTGIMSTLSPEALSSDPDVYKTIGQTIGDVNARSFRLTHEDYTRFSPKVLRSIGAILTAAATEAGEKFKDTVISFNGTENVLANHDAETLKTNVKKVSGEAKYVNAKHYEDLVTTVDESATAESIASAVKKADFYTIRALVAQMVGSDEVSTRRSPEETRKFLKERLAEEEVRTGKPDYFKGLVNGIKEPTETPSKEDLLALELGFRLANATWAVAQPLRGMYEIKTSKEGKTTRGNVKEYPAFAAFDDMVHRMYEMGGLDRAAFEVMKDLEQLQEFVAQTERKKA